MQSMLAAATAAILLISTLERPASAETEQRRSIPPAEAANPLKSLVPGEEFQPPATQALQADDFDNPAFPLVEGGEALWSTAEGAEKKSCQDCHGAGVKNTIRRVAATYPKYAPDAKQVVTLSKRIDLCRWNNMHATPWSEDSYQMISMVSYLESLSRGLPAAVDVTGPAAEVFVRGQKLYQEKMGLLQISCAQCHNANYGQKFGGSVISQGHPLAYPVYKQSEGRAISLHQRFRMCNALARGDGQPDNAPDYVALELYLAWRSKNLPITAPGVRP